MLTATISVHATVIPLLFIDQTRDCRALNVAYVLSAVTNGIVVLGKASYNVEHRMEWSDMDVLICWRNFAWTWTLAWGLALGVRGGMEAVKEEVKAVRTNFWEYLYGEDWRTMWKRGLKREY